MTNPPGGTWAPGPTAQLRVGRRNGWDYGCIVILSWCIYTVEYRRIVGRLISKVTLLKPSIFVSSYGTVLMFSFVVWFNMCGDRSHFLFTTFSFTETS